MLHPHLAKFITDHTVQVPSGFYPVKALTADFLWQLPQKSRASWRRGRIVASLVEAGYVVALANGVHVVAGIMPRGQLREVDGKLELCSAK